VNPGRLLALFSAVATLLTGCAGGGSGLFTQPSPTAGAPTASPAASPLSPAPPLRGGDRIVRVVRRVSPAVLNVKATVADGREADGTGFFIRSDGVAITNDHVVRGAFTIEVVTADGGRFDARVIGGDPDADLAVLRVEGDGPFPTVHLGESASLQLGQTVVALGFALGLEGGPSVTSGIVSALGRTISASDPNAPGGQDVRRYEGLIQTDAAINPGNSGGPLVDLAGRVVGINTAGVGAAAAENIGFAIAIDRARPAIDHAIENPEAPSAYLGVSTQTVTPPVAAAFDLSVDEGALVRAVGPGTPADDAGIQEGDVITALGGSPVASTEELGERILEFEAGQEVEIELARGQETLTVTATLGTRPQPVEG
jgi:serine protease Do